jgi:hypothetical protein
MSERIPLPTESISRESHYAEFGNKKIDVYKLIRLAESVPTQSALVSMFEEHKSNNYWHDSHGEWLGPQDIINACSGVENPETLITDESLDSGLREHITKVLNADYATYSIITIKGVVVDGMHRLTKAFIDGVGNIDVKNFEELPDEICVD